MGIDGMDHKNRDRITGVITGQKKLASDIYSITIKTAAAGEAKAGQFLSLFCSDGSRMLPRPISICEIDREREILRLVYRVVGSGTAYFATLDEGDEIELIGPLGNGFPHERESKKALLIGGGLGVPPMLQLAKELGSGSVTVLGYRDETFLSDDFEATGSKIYYATERGNVGTKGTVIDAIRENDLTADVIYTCGPKPMLAAVKAFAIEKDIRCYVSMEERMACGIGACLGCVCKTTGKNDHTKVENARVCVEGPVFDAGEVML